MDQKGASGTDRVSNDDRTDHRERVHRASSIDAEQASFMRRPRVMRTPIPQVEKQSTTRAGTAYQRAVDEKLEETENVDSLTGQLADLSSRMLRKDSVSSHSSKGSQRATREWTVDRTWRRGEPRHAGEDRGDHPGGQDGGPWEYGYPTRPTDARYMPPHVQPYAGGNPFSQWKFAGSGSKVHPVDFIRKVRKVLRHEGMSESTALYHLENAMVGQAATWWSVHDFASVNEACEALKKRYWSTARQLEVHQEILLGRYAPAENETMSDYVLRYHRENKFLDNPIPEREFVTAVAAHFNRPVQQELRGSLIRDVDRLVETLDAIDADRRRNDQRTRVKTDWAERAVAPRRPYYAPTPATRYRETATSRQGPPRYAWRREPPRDFREEDIPPPRGYRTDGRPAERNDRFERPRREEPPRKQSQTGPPGGPTKSRDTADAGRDKPPQARRAPREETQEVAEGPPEVELTNVGEADEEVLDTDEINVDIPLKTDSRGRPLLNVELAWTEHTHKAEALLDTGSTTSLVSQNLMKEFSNLMKEFSEVLTGEHGEKPPRGGFFRTIKINKTAIASAFSKEGTQCSLMANLDFLGKTTADRTIVWNHSFYVAPRMTRPMILGVDFLRNQEATLTYDKETGPILNIRRSNLCIKSEPEEETTISPEALEPTLEEQEGETVEDDDPPTRDTREEEATFLQPETRMKLQRLLDKYEDLLDGSLGRVKDYRHEIRMWDETPPRPKKYPVPLKHLDAVREEIEDMEANGIIRKEATDYVSPLVIVEKTDGRVRICLDGRAVNERMRNDHAQPLTIDEIIARIGDRKVYSKLDVNQAYWQVEIEPESQKYTGFLFDGQTYVFQRMPFGLKTAGASFTRALDRVIAGVHHLRPYITMYLDDILIASETPEQQIEQLDELFRALQQAGIKLNREKCEFLKPRVSFLGHNLSETKIEMTRSTKEAIRAFPTPQSVRQVQAFLGLANWDRKFVPNLARMTRPLEELTQKGAKFRWDAEKRRAFEEIKKAINDAECLFLVRKDLHYGLETDASCVGLGARLYQFEKRKPHREYTLAYASRALKPAERNYTTTEQEGLALAWALEKFNVILYRRRVYVRTDHRALTFLGSCAIHSRRIARWMEKFQNYDLRIQYIPGASNTIADTLSRNPPPERAKNPTGNELAVTEADPREQRYLNDLPDWIRNAQRDDPAIRDLLRERPNGYAIRGNLVRVRTNDARSDRVVVPDAIAWKLVEKVHKHLVHFGTDKVVQFTKDLFHVNNLDKIARDVAASCETCIASKHYTRPTVGELYYEGPEDTGQTISVDLFGPLPRSHEENKYVLVLMDMFS
ncbi:PREDICTED: uncharacterized protein LOC106743678, partial [Dinoponera quadriceps]|uniref:RNA-directed DNA polymerase n=1 Tax=Dinoponera quadriceps TaxID=609295 RepID=A0A6P3X5Q9_DINQU